jgi:hypothetical protein
MNSKIKNSISSIIFLSKINENDENENYEFHISNNSIFFNKESDENNNNNNNNKNDFHFYSIENINIKNEEPENKIFELEIINENKKIKFKTLNLFDKNTILNLFSKFTGKNINNNNKNLTDIENENLITLKEYFNLENRNFLLLNIKFPENYTQELIKSISQKQFPIYFNEPITTLQKQSEIFENIEILKKSIFESKTENKLLKILNFIFCELSENWKRILKPFNSILGETYEFYNKKLNYVYFSEQVQHKPNEISAFFCKSKEIFIFGDTNYNSNFKMLKGAFEMEFLTKIHLKFNNNLEFVYNKPKLLLKGIFTGKIFVDYCGEIFIYNNFDDVVCKINIEENNFNVDGIIYKINNENNPIFKIKGKWNKNLIYIDQNEKENFLWEINEKKIFGKNENNLNYSMSEFTINLNNINNELKNFLPITDNRFRPDLKLYEQNNIQEAEKIKKKLEQFQRNRHKQILNQNYEPVYFKKKHNILSNDDVYEYKGNYFQSRKNQNFKGEFDIYMIRENKNVDVEGNN